MKKLIALLFLLASLVMVSAQAKTTTSKKKTAQKTEQKTEQKIEQTSKGDHEPSKAPPVREPASEPTPVNRIPASSGGFSTVGVGAVIGDPTGLSLNLFTSASQSIHSIAGWSLGDGKREFTLTSHYTWRRWDFESAKQAAWFYGLGASIVTLDKTDSDNKDGDQFELGPSGTLGLLFDINPMELFLKSNLTLNIVQDTNMTADLMIGVHYNF